MTEHGARRSLGYTDITDDRAGVSQDDSGGGVNRSRSLGLDTHDARSVGIQHVRTATVVQCASIASTIGDVLTCL